VSTVNRWRTSELLDINVSTVNRWRTSELLDINVSTVNRWRTIELLHVNVSTVNRWRTNELLQSDPQRGIMRFGHLYTGIWVPAFRRNIMPPSSVHHNNILIHIELSVCLHQAGSV